MYETADLEVLQNKKERFKLKANFKTNAMRILESVKANYIAHHYDDSNEFKDGVTVAKELGLDESRVYKTLVTVSDTKQYYVFVIPVAKELNLKEAAKTVGEKSVEMIKVSDITKVTGYIRGGCTPIGMKKDYKTVIDISAQSIESFCISAGKRGYQIEIAPQELKKAISFDYADITHK